METHVNRSFLSGQEVHPLEPGPVDDDSLHATSTDNKCYDGKYDGAEVIYPGFAFEVPVYLYIWPVLVLVTCGLNIVVFVVLLKKKMRSSTNTILAAISVSDSLTGLVTIPVYLMVYSKWEDGSHSTGQETLDYTYDYSKTSLLNTSYSIYYNTNDYEVNQDDVSKAAYILSPSLCRSFMLIRHYIAMSFHTISIWLTLFLGFQRFCVVRFPFKSQKWLCKRNLVIACVIICVLAPILHVYHLFNDKISKNGFCEWRVEPGCDASFHAYIWLSLLLKQCFPCVTLLVLTVVFIVYLKRGSEAFERSDSSSSRRKQRRRENRRISLIVILIVTFFLIPEVPYGFFLLYIEISRASSTEMELETNRKIIAAYEILLVLSFHANFWIYLGFNSHFRDELKVTLFSPFVEIQRRLSLSSHGSISRTPKSPKHTDNTDTKAQVALHEIEPGELDKLNN